VSHVESFEKEKKRAHGRLGLNSLSDESSVIPGSLGLLPSSSLAGAPDPKETVMGLYEP
jgi:hypothetical protein